MEGRQSQPPDFKLETHTKPIVSIPVGESDVLTAKSQSGTVEDQYLSSRREGQSLEGRGSGLWRGGKERRDRRDIILMSALREKGFRRHAKQYSEGQEVLSPPQGLRACFWI